ncbi:MAG: HIT domain-containing protein [Succinivibrionaceae bacterium]|nr:HIT domain-containing protein [Succinivibrionaceae bacterium]
MEHPDCMYCNKNDKLRSLMIEVGELPYSTLYLFRDQRHRGRCVLAFRGRHVDEMYRLTEEERNGFFADAARVQQAIANLVHPGKMNCGIFGDTMKHVHMHICPKEVGGLDWGGFFTNTGEPGLLSEAEYQELVAALKGQLGI